MGQYQFAIPKSDRFVRESMINAQVIGLEGIPWPGKNLISETHLTIHRNQDISGRLLIPFRTEKYGDIALATGTLPETGSPYLLDLELARGTLSRLRNQISIWEEGGLEIEDEFRKHVDSCIDAFAEAVFVRSSDEPRRVELCQAVLDRSVELMFVLTREFSQQIAAIHRDQKQKVAIIAGAVIDSRRPIDADIAISELAVQRMVQPEPLLSSETDLNDYDFTGMDDLVNWINEPNLKTVRVLGPLLQFDNIDLPPWMSESATFEERLDQAKRFCRNFGVNYAKQVRVLHVASGISGVGHQHFNYPQQLQLTLEMIESLDQAMPNTSMMVSFDQPWGERLAMATGGIPPMEIADSLLRYGARISAIGLEFNLDYAPQGTLIRDPFQWVDLIDRWSQFGLPLAIYLSAPLGDESNLTASRFSQTIARSASPDAQEEYLETIFNLLVRRPAVNVVAWRRAFDHDNRRFPLSGLCGDRHEKPMLETFSHWVEEVSD